MFIYKIRQKIICHIYVIVDQTCSRVLHASQLARTSITSLCLAPPAGGGYCGETYRIPPYWGMIRPLWYICVAGGG